MSEQIVGLDAEEGLPSMTDEERTQARERAKQELRKLVRQMIPFLEGDVELDETLRKRLAERLGGNVEKSSVLEQKFNRGIQSQETPGHRETVRFLERTANTIIGFLDNGVELDPKIKEDLLTKLLGK